MRACHVVANINRLTGGPSVSVTRLATELVKRGLSCSLCTLNYPELGQEPPTPGVDVISVNPNRFTRTFGGWSPALARLTSREASRGNVVHNHGIWLLPNLYARRAATRAQRPLIISPRGMLEPWSLQHKRWKKSLAWSLFERRNLWSAAIFHATSRAECASIRAAGFSQPIAVVRNGVDLPGSESGRESLETRWPQLRGKSWVLFLSRLHPKKGLTELIEVWTRLHARYPGHHLILAGPASNEYGQVIEHLIKTKRLETSVVVTGMLEGGFKTAALQNAAFLVLPTHSENFGIAIAEALAHGIPALTTKAAPWEDLIAYRCGWWIEDCAEALESAMHQALATPESVRQEMGARGRRLAESKYSWASVATQMLHAYRWCCGMGERPEFVASQ